MANVFNSVQGLHPKRNAFSAHTYRNDFTANLGVNIPVYVQEVPPATRVRVATSALVRLQALIAPVMDDIDFYVHFWQLPYRLLENDRFTQFISGEIEPEDYHALFATPYELAEEMLDVATGYPYDTPQAFVESFNKLFGNGSLFDFLGYDVDLFPVCSYNELDDEFVLSGGNNVTKLNWRAFIAYMMLHLHWYMNENVPYFTKFNEYVDTLVKNQSLNHLCELIWNVQNSFDSLLYPHGWEKDYFTSGLPNVQFGDPVTLPLGGTAPVRLSDEVSYLGIDGNLEMRNNIILKGANSFPITNRQLITDSQGKLTGVLEGEDPERVQTLSSEESYIEGSPIYYDSEDSAVRNPYIADLSEASAITINELRFANALQKFKERQLRFGRRRLEYYKGFFDVTPEDLRLQVPKYLGGGRIPINISDIEQTSSTSGSQALGHLAGKATAVAGGFAGFKTFCSEETILIGIAFAMPHITYAKAVSRFKLKTNDIYDYFNPSFEHLGEQAIENIEIYSGATEPDKEFAYTPRYNEYRFHMNEMHGAFKDTLSYWTLGRIFDSQPALNPSFVYMQPSNFNRIFAVEGEPPMLVSMIFRQRIVQPVSKYGTPMLLA